MPLDLHSNPLLRGVISGRSLQHRQIRSAGDSWTLEALAGRIVELDGGLTMAAELLHAAQVKGEPAVWIGDREDMVFPPDLDACGIDLAALPVIRATSAAQAWKATDTLLRSGAFSLLILSPAAHWNMTETVQTLLHRHTREQSSVLLLLRRAAGIRPPARHALRAQSRIHQEGFDTFHLHLHVTPGASQASVWSQTHTCRGPEGLV